MTSYPLGPSPITAIRHRHGISQDDAAARLGITKNYLRVLEMRSKTVPADVLDVIDALLSPPSRYTQMTIWEGLAELDRLAAQDGGEAHG